MQDCFLSLQVFIDFQAQRGCLLVRRVLDCTELVMLPGNSPELYNVPEAIYYHVALVAMHGHVSSSPKNPYPRREESNGSRNQQ